MSQYITLLSDISFMARLIGYSEYCERCEIADWLIDSRDCTPDPRMSGPESKAANPEREYPEESVDNGETGGTGISGNEDSPWFELLMMNKWMFTIGDPDCYPSVPHGHHKSKNIKWPKLNPYTGRVFSGMHSEDAEKRLAKNDMRKLWSDSKFVEHCREQVLWYSDFAPSYGFPGARQGNLVFPRWK